MIRRHLLPPTPCQKIDGFFSFLSYSRNSFHRREKQGRKPLDATVNRPQGVHIADQCYGIYTTIVVGDFLTAVSIVYSCLFCSSSIYHILYDVVKVGVECRSSFDNELSSWAVGTLGSGHTGQDVLQLGGGWRVEGRVGPTNFSSTSPAERARPQIFCIFRGGDF